MQTLTQYEYLDRDMIMKGVANWIVKESPILGILPQKSIQGNSFKYNVSLTLPTTNWLTVGDQIVENTGTFEQRSTDIYTLIQDALTDKSAIALNSTQNPEAIDAELAAQALAHEWEDTFIHGQTTTSSTTKQFKGLMRILAEFESATTTDLDGATDPGTGNNTQVIAVNATSGALTMVYMDALIDQIKPGRPDLLLMSRRTRRKLNALQRASGATTGTGGVLMRDKSDFGAFMDTYDGIPIHVSDFQLDNLPDGSSSGVTISTYDKSVTRASSFDNTIIWAMQFGDRKVQGLNAGQMTHERETFVEDYNAIKNRYIWYTGLMCASKFSLAALVNVNPDT